MKSSKDKKSILKYNSSLNLIKRLWFQLKPRRKKQLIGLILLMILSGLSEIISIASFIPFITSLSNSRILFENKYINIISNYFNIYSQQSIILITTLIFVLFVIISTIIRIINVWLNYRMTALIGSDISLKAYRNIIYQPHNYISSINSGELISILNNQLDFTVSSISLILRILTNTIILIIIGIGLLYIDFQLAILSSILIIFPYIFITIYTKRRVYKNSKIINYSLINKVKSIQDSLNLNKEIIVNELHSKFVKKYKINEIVLRDKQTENNFLSMFPRYTMEGIGITSIALLASLFTNIRAGGGDIIPFLGALTLAAQRLVPTLQQIYAGFANLRGYSSAINSVLEICDLKIFKSYLETKKRDLVFQDNLSLKNIYFNFDESKKQTLKKINFKIFKGEKIGIIGDTGSGKSTLLNLLSGFIVPTSGEILLDNQHVISSHDENNLRSWYKLISHVPQNIYLKDGSIWENITLSDERNNVDEERMIWAAEQSLILDYINQSEEGFDSRVGEKGIKISGGQSQRIGIARALYKKSNVLLLDEVTSALDINTEKLLIKNLMNLKNNITIVFIAHRLSTLSRCSRILEIKNGSIKNIHTPESLGLS